MISFELWGPTSPELNLFQDFSIKEQVNSLLYLDVCLALLLFTNESLLGRPWRSSGQDPELPLQGARVRSPVREVRP